MRRTPLPLLVFGALVHCRRHNARHRPSGRSSTNIADAAARLDGVPRTLGDWRGEEEPLDAADLQRSGIRGHFSCRYRNIVTGEKIWLLILCGRSGPISVHTPDICYGEPALSAGGQYKKNVPVEHWAPCEWHPVPAHRPRGRDRGQLAVEPGHGLVSSRQCAARHLPVPPRSTSCISSARLPVYQARKRKKIRVFRSYRPLYPSWNGY